MNIYKLPPINNWELFEKLCKDLWENQLKDFNVDRFGRGGQKQKGLDITCSLKDKIIGIQCKCVENLKIRDIDDELKKLDELEIKLEKYIIATTISRDVKLKEHILEKSQKDKYPFDITIKFWEDITDMLFEDSNKNILNKYYPHYFYDDTQISRILNQGIKQFNEGNYKSAENYLNIVKNSLKELNNKNKYEFLILEGRYLELCRNYINAGKKYIEAYEYSSKDIKSKYYKVLGLYYNNENEKAKDICNKIIKEEPLNELAYSLLVLIEKDELDIPKELCDSSKINYNKGITSFLKRKYKKSYEFFKKSECKSPIQLINCVNSRFQLFLEDEKFPIIINQKDYDKLIKIQNIFQESINQFSDEILTHYFDQLLQLLSINRLLKNDESLKENVERGLKIDENNKELLFYKAFLLEKEENDEEALEILKKNPEVLDSFKLISIISIRNDNYNQIIHYGEKILDNIDKTSEQYLFCQNALIDAYIELNRFEDAKTLIKFIKNPFRYNLLKSKLYSEKSEKLKFLLKSYENIENGFIIEKIILATEFSQLDEFEYSISIYESTIDLKRYSSVTDDLGYCYFSNEDYGKLIELCEHFTENEEYHKYLMELEIKTYLKINDFDEALRLINIYLEHVESNYTMRIAKAKIHLFKRDYEKVDEFIKEKHDFEKIPVGQCIEIYAICKTRINNPIKLFEILLEIRNKHENELIIHNLYVSEFLNSKLTFNNPSEVNYDVGVLLKYDNKNELVYVTKYNRDIHKFNQFEKIIGLKSGDTITLESNMKIKILGIYDKFTFAFKESSELVKNNPNDFIKFFHYDTIEEEINQIKEITLNKNENLNNLKKQYQNKFLIIPLFSEVSGLDIYDSYFYLKNYGLKSFANNEKDKLPIKQDLVLDTTSLMTIHLLEIENKISENYNLYISASEYFLLKQIKETAKLNLNSEMIVGYDENKNFSVSYHDYKEKYDSISKIISWIDDYCQIKETKALFELNKKDKKNINQIPYPNIRENILLAYDNCILISDDLDMKTLLNKYFKINIAGTLTLIQDMLNKELINMNQYEDLILKLYELNFKDVPITPKLLITSIKQENYNIIIKFIFNFIKTPQKYLDFNWDIIIKTLNQNNIYEKIIYEMLIKFLSNAIFITYCDPTLIKIEYFSDEKYIGSINSKTFHDPHCSFVKRISEKNIIQFYSKEEALNKGYKSCNKCIK